MDNLRTAKKTDIERFVKTVLDDYEVRSAVNFNLYSFYFDFSFSLPSGDSDLRDRIELFFSELHKRGIITEEPIKNFKAYKTDSRISETFIHSFNIVE